MDLLDFARGPALTLALVVFVSGTLWRLFGVLRRPRLPDLSPAARGCAAQVGGCAARHRARHVAAQGSSVRACCSSASMATSSTSGWRWCFLAMRRTLPSSAA